MDTQTPSVTTPISEKDKKKELTFLDKVKNVFVEALAVLFWVYVLFKLFVFDLDIYIINLLNPKLIWVSLYKFPIILGVGVITILLTRSLNLALSILYIICYPLIILGWKIPRFIWVKQSWLLTFAFVNSLISIYRSFKRNFVLGSLFFIATLLIIVLDSKSILYLSGLVILTILTAFYVLAFIKAFKPSAVFQLYTKVFPVIRKSDFLKIDSATVSLPIDQLDLKQIESRTISLQNFVLYNRICLFISKKLKDYQRSTVNLASYVLNTLFLLLFTIVSFGLVNYALFKLDPSMFSTTYGSPSLFSFMYYSTSSMFYNTNGFEPISTLSQGLQMMEFLSSVLLIGILFAISISVRNEKYSAEIEEVIKSVEAEGKSIEGLIQESFNLSDIGMAIESLKQAKAGLTGFIVYLTKGIGE